MPYYALKYDDRINKPKINISKEEYKNEEPAVFKISLKEEYSDYIDHREQKESYYIVSDEFKKVIDMYVTNLLRKAVVFIEEENQRVYWILKINEKEGILEKDNNQLKRVTLKESINEDIFKVTNENEAYLIVSLELVESILRRGLVGIKFKEVEVYSGNGSRKL